VCSVPENLCLFSDRASSPCFRQDSLLFSFCLQHNVKLHVMYNVQQVCNETTAAVMEKSLRMTL